MRFDAPDEPRHERRRRALVDLRRRAHLLDVAGAEHGDAIAQRERLVLVVGDEDERDTDAALHLLELPLHLLAQLGVERAQRFVEQQHAGTVDQRTRQGNALALAAAELRRLARFEAAEAHGLQDFRDSRGALTAGHAADAEAVPDVLPDRHVRKECVVLEHRVDVALEGRHVGDVASVQPDPCRWSVARSRR